MNVLIPLIAILISLANPIPCNALFKKQSTKKEHKKTPKTDKKKSPLAPKEEAQPLSKPLLKPLPQNDLEQKIMTFFETNITPIYTDLNELHKGEEIKKSIETAQKKRAEREKTAAAKRKSDSGRRQGSYSSYGSSGRRYSPSSYGSSGYSSRRPSSYGGSSYSSPSYRSSGKSYDPFSKSSSSFDSKPSSSGSEKSHSYSGSRSKDKKKNLDPQKKHEQALLEKSQKLQKDLQYLASKNEPISSEDFNEIYNNFTSRNSALSSLTMQERDTKKAQLKQQELGLWKSILNKIKNKNEKTVEATKKAADAAKKAAALPTATDAAKKAAETTKKSAEAAEALKKDIDKKDEEILIFFSEKTEVSKATPSPTVAP